MQKSFLKAGGSFPAKRLAIGTLVLIILYFLVKFMVWKYSTFYLSSYEQYREWFPEKYAIVFPVVKIFPFAISIVVLFIFKKFILNYFVTLVELLRLVVLSLKKTARNVINRILKISAIIINYSINGIKTAGIFILSSLQPGVRIFLKPETLLKIGLVIISLFISIIIAEMLLRNLNYKPGIIFNASRFTEVDSVFVRKGFISDTNGIFKVSHEAAEFLHHEMTTKKYGDKPRACKEDEDCEVYALFDFMELQNADFSNDLKLYINLLSKEEDLNDFQQAVLEYAKKPINDDGFRSIPFKKYESDNTSILLLGDSFTWGHLASNLTNSFADILLAKNFVVYNTGITGADPAQYLALAKKYIPALQPDYVMVNLFLGNDVRYYKRELQPGRVIYYHTNAGNVDANPDGIFIDSPEQAYEYAVAHMKIPATTFFNKLCLKSTVGTLLWKYLWKKDWVENYRPAYKSFYEKRDLLLTNFPYCNIELEEIKSIAEKNGTKFLVVAIPELKDNGFILPKDFPGLTSTISIHVPEVSKRDYDIMDGHYNDSGHRKHAEFIMQLIKEAGVKSK